MVLRAGTGRVHSRRTREPVTTLRNIGDGMSLRRIGDEAHGKPADSGVMKGVAVLVALTRPLPNKTLQQTAAAILVSRSSLTHPAAAAAEVGR